MGLFKYILSSFMLDRVFKEEVEFLRGVSLFEGVPANSLGVFLSIAHRKAYSDGETIFEEGQIGRVFYIVRRGEVGITIQGKRISSMGAGEFFGEMALLEELPRTATVTCEKDCELLLMYKIRFDSLLEKNPSAGVRLVRNLAAILSSRLRQQNCGLVNDHVGK